MAISRGSMTKQISKPPQKRKRPSSNRNVARGCGTVLSDRRKVTKRARRKKRNG
jgi:hypothetical protein